MDMITENKVVPNLRFREFNDSWEKKKLGDVGKVKMCKRIFSNQTTKDGEIPFYKIGMEYVQTDGLEAREMQSRL